MVPQLLTASGIALLAYAFIRGRGPQIGSKVVVHLKDVVAPEFSALAMSLDVDLVAEVVKVDGDKVTGRLLTRMQNTSVPGERVGMLLTFPKSAIKHTQPAD